MAAKNHKQFNETRIIEQFSATIDFHLLFLQNESLEFKEKKKMNSSAFLNLPKISECIGIIGLLSP